MNVCPAYVQLPIWQGHQGTHKGMGRARITQWNLFCYVQVRVKYRGEVDPSEGGLGLPKLLHGCSGLPQRLVGTIKHMIASLPSKHLFLGNFPPIYSNTSLCGTHLCHAMLRSHSGWPIPNHVGEVTSETCLAVCKHVPVPKASSIRCMGTAQSLSVSCS